MSDVSAYVPILTLVLGFFLSPFTKRSEVRNTLRIEAGDLLADLEQTIRECRKAQDRAPQLVALNRLRLRLRAVRVPTSMMEHICGKALDLYRVPEGDEHREAWRKALWDFRVASEYVAGYLGTVNPLAHLGLRLALFGRIRGWYPRPDEPSAEETA